MINERKGFPWLVSPMPFGLSGWQAKVSAVPAMPAFPGSWPPSWASQREIQARREVVGTAGVHTLCGVQHRAEVPYQGTWAEQLEGCSGGRWGRNGGGFGRGKAGGFLCAPQLLS